MTPTFELRKNREPVQAMIREFQTNRAILDGLLEGYGTFRFTGGLVPREPWDLIAIGSYRQRPFAAGRISTEALERYRHLADSIMASGQAIAAATWPMSLRSRYNIADTFDRDSSEIRVLGDSLETAMTQLAEELMPSPPPSETESGESGYLASGVYATTTRGSR